MSTSTRSVFGNPEPVTRFITYVHSIDLVFITESWLDDSVSDRELSSDGRFQVFRCDRPSRGGGVVVLVRQDIACTEILNDNLLETIIVDLHLKSSSVRLVCSYLTNSGCSSVRRSRILSLCSSLESLCDFSFPVILIGDFNLPLIG